MNFLNLTFTLIGVLYLGYSVVRRDKTKRFVETREVTLIKSSEFLKLQLKFSIANSIYLIVSGILLTVFNLNGVFIIAVPLPFHLINGLLIIEGKRKGYINY